MRDTVLAGTFAGIAGGLFYQVFVWVLLLSGIAQTTPFRLGAYVLVRPGVNLSSLPAQGLGAAQHFALASLFGIIIVYLLRLVGTDFLAVKGLVYGGIIYFLIYGVLAKAVIPVHILQPDLTTSIVHLFGNLFFGLTTTYIAGYLVRAAGARS